MSSLDSSMCWCMGWILVDVLCCLRSSKLKQSNCWSFECGCYIWLMLRLFFLSLIDHQSNQWQFNGKSFEWRNNRTGWASWRWSWKLTKQSSQQSGSCEFEFGIMVMADQIDFNWTSIESLIITTLISSCLQSRNRAFIHLLEFVPFMIWMISLITWWYLWPTPSANTWSRLLVDEMLVANRIELVVAKS